MIQLLPKIYPSLKSSNQLERWITFNKLIADGKFPTNNIPYLLFLDIVEFLLSQDQHSMRLLKLPELERNKGILDNRLQII